ncbi:replication initiation protein [Corynebacterium belfantii]|uniref:replication initiation protein n=1 Tax=Corynebacterium belfantii TaxID=2014537 RepID=UPI001F39EB03|nr:replication initiation protein [Corynebacterium belfantii]
MMRTITAPTDLPDGRFEQLWLPLWPLASDNLREGIYRTSNPKALGKHYVEANPDAISNLLVVDIDHEDALLRAMWNRAQWRPNTVVENPANGHAHAVWALEVPRVLLLGIRRDF